MMPKRQQKRKLDQKRAVNDAKTATFTGPGTIELSTKQDKNIINKNN